MAEWIGPRHRRRSSPEETDGPSIPPDAPESPGAVASPQMPGEVPDRSSIPGQYATYIPASPNPRRPLVEYKTAQRIMGVFRAEPGKEREPARFEQATASFEELRKADPTLLPPSRPAPGFLLGEGESVKQLEQGESAADTGF